MGYLTNVGSRPSYILFLSVQVIFVAGKREFVPPLGNFHNAATALLLVSGMLYLWFQSAIGFFTAKMGLKMGVHFQACRVLYYHMRWHRISFLQVVLENKVTNR